jgi:hypothetical protein
MYRAQKTLGLVDDALYEKLSKTLESALQRLYNDQHVDGGWGWFIDDSSDQLVSAYTLLGLAEAKAAGWQVDGKVFARAVDGLQKSLKNVDDRTPAWDLNRQAFILYVLARASQEDVIGSAQTRFYDVSRSVKLFDQRDRMNLDARAFLAMDFAILEPSSGYHRVPLMDSIKKAAKYPHRAILDRSVQRCLELDDRHPHHRHRPQGAGRNRAVQPAHPRYGALVDDGPPLRLVGDDPGNRLVGDGPQRLDAANGRSQAELHIRYFRQ